ncbi:hypothetical protein C6A37_13370, partial [Desulfobacteraceae bacterium SEEP-SAG9]
GIVLALSEEPKVIWMNTRAVRLATLRGFIEDPEWRLLLELLWESGFRLAKFEILKEGVDIRVFAKSS